MFEDQYLKSLLQFEFIYRIIDIKCLLSYMKKSVLSSLDFLPYFTIEAIKQLLEDESVADSTILTAVYRWVKAKKVIRLKKGVYMSSRFYELHHSDAEFSSMVSAILLPQSYLSLEYILQRQGNLTEITYPVTSITIKQTRMFENQLGTFTYRNIKADLFIGFNISEYQGIPISKATPAKALFDYFYLRFWRESDDPVEELRLNLEDFTQNDWAEFASFIEISKSRKMDRIYKNLRRNQWLH